MLRLLECEASWIFSAHPALRLQDLPTARLRQPDRILAFFSLLSLFPLVFLLLYGISFLVSQDVIDEQFLLSFL